MYENFFNKNFAQTENFIEPVVKANKLAASNFEKLVNFQMNAFQAYVDMGLEQMNAAAEINSPQTFQAFLGKQVEASNTFRQKVMDDTKKLFEMGNDFKEAFTDLAEDSVEDITESAKSVTKAATTRKAA